MKIWILTVGEPLPTDGENVRLWRTGNLCEKLSQRNHEVTWWTSRFDHFTKLQRNGPIPTSNYQIRFLEGRPYSSHIGVKRLLHNKDVARHFEKLSQLEAPPDLILASYPTIELSRAATRFGKEKGIPVLLDVRDLWPDIFASAFPRLLKSISPLFLYPYRRMARETFSSSSGIFGISQTYLEFGLRYAKRTPQKADLVIPLGFEPPKLSLISLEQASTKLKAMGVNTEKCILWFSGTFGRTTDLTHTIETARKMESEGYKEYQFVFAGSGEQEARWRQLAKGLSNIVFTGWCNAAELRALGEMASFGLCAYSRSAPEQMPNKIHEYLYYGLPILCNLEGETRDFLERNQFGIYYNPKGSPSLLDALLKNTSEKLTFKKPTAKTSSTDTLVDFLENQWEC